MPTTKGIMGFVKLGGVGLPNNGELRVSSFTLKAAQDISAMETIDNNYDYTAYRYGPVRIEGEIGFPVPVGGAFFEEIVKFVAKRDGSAGAGGSGSGNLSTPGVAIEAAYDHAFRATFRDCKPNTLSVSIAAEEALDFSISFIGTDRVWGAGLPSLTRLSPERVLTWNDIIISAGASTGGGGVAPSPWVAGPDQSAQVRNFSFEINNNLTAFFGLNGDIFVVGSNIIAGKREITGSMEIAWNGSLLQDFAYSANTNTAFCSSAQEITMAVTNKDSGGGANTVPVEFLGVIFNMEDISLTNDFFMGTQTWRAYGDSTNNYKALTLDGTTL